MFIPKKYGENKIERCPFCSEQAFTRNEQGIPVCADHKHEKLADLKCMCGSYLDVRLGKFGAFCICDRCGTMNMNKVLEMNPQVHKGSFKKVAKANAYTNEYGRVEYVRSDDPRFGFR
jgi:hypothetical protein